MNLPSSRSPLSPREQEILLLAADWNSDKEICRRLDISQSTVERDWEFALAWLNKYMTGESSEP